MIDKIIAQKRNILFYGGILFAFLLLITLMSASFRYFLSSAYFWLNSRYASKDILVVALDEHTLNSENFKRYQEINRCDYASLLRNIASGEPKAVGVDIFFAQKSEDISCDKELLDLSKSHPNIVFGTEVVKKDPESNDENEYYISPLFWDKRVENTGIVDILSLDKFPLLSFFTKQISNAIEFYPLWQKNGTLPLSLEVYKRAYGIKSMEIRDDSVYLNGKKTIPLSDNVTNINFFTPAYPTVSFVDVIEKNVNPEIFRDKVIFIGATARDIHDEFLTPYDTFNFMSGVMIHANMYNTIESSRFLRYESFLAFITINSLLLISFIYILLSASNLLYGILRLLGALVGYIIITLLAFNIFWLYIDIYPVFVAYIVASLTVYLQKYFTEKKSKDEVKSIFSRYISEDVANEILKVWVSNLGLWGKEREITVFFSDIAGFTDLSEDLKPEDLWRILNVYFEEMSSIILSEHGTIDKFIGDAIMAFWNAPLDLKDHANRACVAALLQRKALDKVRNEVRALGSKAFIDMRIGLNTGKAVIGNFGCSKRYDYTALGDTVNLSSRLEGINKQYGTNIIISESTYEQIDKEKFITRELDMITVKWKVKPIRIYELIGFKTESNEEEKLEFYKNALRLYRDQKFHEAKEVFEKINDAPSGKFIERCEKFIENPPEKDWDGVYRFKDK